MLYVVIHFKIFTVLKIRGEGNWRTWSWMNNECLVTHFAVAEVSRLREGAVRVEDVLLVPDQRGHPVPPGLPPPPRRDRPLYPQEAGARRTTTEVRRRA